MSGNFNFLYNDNNHDENKKRKEKLQLVLDEIAIEEKENGSRPYGDLDKPGSSSNKSVVKKKLAEMIINNSWNDKNEKLIVSIGENSACYKWMHEKSAQMFNFISSALGISLVILNTGLSAQTLIPENIIILQNVIIYVVTLISVVKSFLKYEDLASKHLVYAGKFAEVYHIIQQQMVLYRKDRINAVEFIKKTLGTYDELVISGPEINEIIRKKFKRLFLSSDISVPDIADRIQRIEIITENPLTSTDPDSELGQRSLTNKFCISNDITDEDLSSECIQLNKIM